jgi:DNA primase
MHRYSKNVTVLFDGDAAGTRASLRGIDILLEEDLNVKAVALPEGEDPDSYSRQLGASSFRHYLEENSRDFIEFKTSMLLAEAADDPIQKAEVIRDIVLSISKIRDEIKRSLYLQQCSNLLDIDESALVSELNKLLREKANKEYQKKAREQDTVEQESVEETESIERPVQPINPIVVQEKETIRLLLNYTDAQIQIDDDNELPVIEFILNEIIDVKFQNSVYQKIIDVIKDRFQEGKLTSYEFFLDYPDDEIQQVAVELTTQRYEISEYWSSRYQIHIPTEQELLKNVAFSNVMRLKFRIVQRMIELETMKLKQASGEELDGLLDEITYLKKLEVQIAEILGNVTVK